MKIIYIPIFCIGVMLAIAYNKGEESTLRSQNPAKYITNPSKLDMIYSLKAVDKKEWSSLYNLSKKTLDIAILKDYNHTRI